MKKRIYYFSMEKLLLFFQKGQFAIFFPQDLHRLGIQVSGSAKLKKVVIKVKI